MLWLGDGTERGQAGAADRESVLGGIQPAKDVGERDRTRSRQGVVWRAISDQAGLDRLDDRDVLSY